MGDLHRVERRYSLRPSHTEPTSGLRSPHEAIMSSRTSLLAIVTGIVVSSSAWSPGASVAAEAVEVRAGGLQPVDGTWLPNPGPFDQDMTRYVINDSVL